LSDQCLTIDTSEVEKKMRKVLAGVSAATSRRAIKVALDRLLKQAILISPTVPRVTGILRGDRNSEWTPTKKVNTLATLVEGYLAFRAPYAAYQHEGMRRDGSHVIVNHSEAGSGAKFLEAKLARADLRKELLDLMGHVINQGIKDGGEGGEGND
jgi:hypothetical protein